MLLKSLKLQNFLSFGPAAEAVELLPLNVLIGPNGSGKSNFIEAIDLLRSTPKGFRQALVRSGGAEALRWRGASKEQDIIIEASLDVSEALLTHTLFVEPAPLAAERVLVEGRDDALFFRGPSGLTYVTKGTERVLLGNKFDSNRSVLEQLRDPEAYPELAALGDAYESVRLYKHWTLGAESELRRHQPAELPAAHLSERLDNLALVLNRLRNNKSVKDRLLEKTRLIFEGALDIGVEIFAGTIQILLEEERWTIPATRLSDGTMRWLALLAVLLDPEPPPLVCIEEPELGLHPDLISDLRDLLKEASTRTQLIVTTHSETLVDALSKTPEDVIVCERANGSTNMQRLDRSSLAEWLKDYSLGALWSKGELGGNRW